MTKHERMLIARRGLMGLEEALVDLLTEHEGFADTLNEFDIGGDKKGMQPSKIAQELDLLLPEKGETYGSESHRYNLIWGILDHLCAKGIIYHAKDGARLSE